MCLLYKPCVFCVSSIGKLCTHKLLIQVYHDSLNETIDTLGYEALFVCSIMNRVATESKNILVILDTVTRTVEVPYGRVESYTRIIREDNPFSSDEEDVIYFSDAGVKITAKNTIIQRSDINYIVIGNTLVVDCAIDRLNVSLGTATIYDSKLEIVKLGCDISRITNSVIDNLTVYSGVLCISGVVLNNLTVSNLEKCTITDSSTSTFNVHRVVAYLNVPISFLEKYHETKSLMTNAPGSPRPSEVYHLTTNGQLTALARHTISKLSYLRTINSIDPVIFPRTYATSVFISGILSFVSKQILAINVTINVIAIPPFANFGQFPIAQSVVVCGAGRVYASKFSNEVKSITGTAKVLNDCCAKYKNNQTKITFSPMLTSIAEC